MGGTECNEKAKKAPLELVDVFYAGAIAHEAGLSRKSCPKSFSKKCRGWWLSGFKDAKQRKLNPGLGTEGYDRVSSEADATYHLDMRNGTVTECPYPPDTEANDIWVTRYYDCHTIFGGRATDCETLGAPREVQHIANPDGTHTYYVAASPVP